LSLGSEKGFGVELALLLQQHQKGLQHLALGVQPRMDFIAGARQAGDIKFIDRPAV
jgi:hypothetical protein